MGEQDRARWEAKHEQELGGSPSPILQFVPEAGSGGLALDLACGQGRNIGCLLDKGYRVVAADISARALERVLKRYPNAPVICVQVDFDQWSFGQDCFDLVLQTDFLDRRLFPWSKTAVRVGGVFVIETFYDSGRGRDQPGPSNPVYRLERGELERTFPSPEWKSLYKNNGSIDTGRAGLISERTSVC